MESLVFEKNETFRTILQTKVYKGLQLGQNFQKLFFTMFEAFFHELSTKSIEILHQRRSLLTSGM